MGRGWKNLEVHARKSLHCHEWAIKGGLGKGSEEGKSIDKLQSSYRIPKWS